MDTSVLVRDTIDEGQEIVDQLARDGFAITSAFWLKLPDERKWHFHVVSPSAETEVMVEAYRQIHDLVRRLPEPR